MNVKIIAVFTCIELLLMQPRRTLTVFTAGMLFALYMTYVNTTPARNATSMFPGGERLSTMWFSLAMLLNIYHEERAEEPEVDTANPMVDTANPAGVV